MEDYLFPDKIFHYIKTIHYELFLYQYYLIVQEINRITDLNLERTKVSPNFYYRNEEFRSFKKEHKGRGFTLQLHPSLSDEMNTLYALLIKTKDEAIKVRMYLSNLLTDSKTWQELINKTPQQILDLDENLRNIPKTEELYLINEIPTFTSIINYYSALKLVV